MTAAPWVRFEIQERRAGRRTDTWRVLSTTPSATLLGFVYWWPAWRQYIFAPSPQCVFNRTCLRDLAAFCETQTATRAARPATAARAHTTLGP